MVTLPFSVKPVAWSVARDDLRRVRYAVFVEEQRVPEELEWDDLDEVAWHVLAVSSAGEPIGTGRLLPEGRIGRMAVAREWRGRGVGATLLQALIEHARATGLHRVHLHAQTHALHFYARSGFVVEGEEFDEAGIPHRAMTLTLAPPTRSVR
jgi:predicted GNAT family N-acyltransferase